MKSHQLPCKGFQRFLGDQLREGGNNPRRGSTVYSLVDGCNESIRLDDHVSVVLRLGRSVNTTIGRHHDVIQKRWGNRNPKSGGQDTGYLDHLLQEFYVPVVLLDGRLDSDERLSVPDQEFALGGNLDPVIVVFRLEHIDVEKPIDQEMVDLRDEPPVLKPQVVNDGPVHAVLVTKIDIVGGALLAPCAGADALDLALDEEPLLGGYYGEQNIPCRQAAAYRTESL